MIDITYRWEKRNDVILQRTLGIGHKKGNTNLGQSDLITIIEETINPITGEVCWGDMLFSSGSWIRRLKYRWQQWRGLP
jgi:hypothetical protein